MIKRISILTIIILSTLFSFGQKKCKFDYDKEDKVTGNKIQYITYNLFATGVKIQIGNNGKQSYFNFGYDMLGDKYEIIKKETDTLYIRLANKELIKLNPKENTKGTSHINTIQKQIFTFYSPMYDLNEDQLKLLAESPIVAFKFLIEGKEFSVEMPEKKSDKIMDGFDCLKQSK
jgi:hypothetical protein